MVEDEVLVGLYWLKLSNLVSNEKIPTAKSRT